MTTNNQDLLDCCVNLVEDYLNSGTSEIDTTYLDEFLTSKNLPIYERDILIEMMIDEFNDVKYSGPSNEI